MNINPQNTCSVIAQLASHGCSCTFWVSGIVSPGCRQSQVAGSLACMRVVLAYRRELFVCFSYLHAWLLRCLLEHACQVSTIRPLPFVIVWPPFAKPAQWLVWDEKNLQANLNLHPPLLQGFEYSCFTSQESILTTRLLSSLNGTFCPFEQNKECRRLIQVFTLQVDHFDNTVLSKSEGFCNTSFSHDSDCYWILKCHYVSQYLSSL